MEKPDPQYTGEDIVFDFKNHGAKTKDGKYECIHDGKGYSYWYSIDTGFRVGDWQTGYTFIASKASNNPAEEAERLNKLIRGEIRNKRWWEENP